MGNPEWYYRVMPQSTDGDELRAKLAGYELVNAMQWDEVRAMSAGEKLRTISQLMSAASLFDMSRREHGDQLVIEIWQRLRHAHGCR